MNGSETLLLSDEAATARLARLIADHLRPVDCLTLTGNLGAGKTTLMRYLIQHLQQEQSAVISPSFMIMQEYDVRIQAHHRELAHPTEQGEAAERCGVWGGSPIQTKLYHVDGYRLNDEGEIPELGLEECFETGIVAIEWPEKFGYYLPKNRLELTLELADNGSRRATLQGRGEHEKIAAQISEEFHGNA